jgi:phage terminase small subunit
MLTDKQKMFCIEFVSGKDATNAYCIGYEKQNNGVARAAASRLLKSPIIQKYIYELQAENKKIVDLANDKAADVIVQGSIADANERMVYLSKLLRGEISIKQETASGGQLVEVLEVPSFSERIKAIAELNKMVGDYAPTKQETTLKSDKPPTKIKFIDGTEIEI